MITSGRFWVITEADPAVRHEVGCWSHCRRKIWETAITSHDPIAREALARIGRIFALDRTWKAKPHAEIKALRELHLRPHTDAFFAFVTAEYEHVKDRRGMLRSALGYAVRQQGALTRFFDDGRLKLTNNDSERELRRIALGRKNFLFVGNPECGENLAGLYSLIATCDLHGVDPVEYIKDVLLRVDVHPAADIDAILPHRWTPPSRVAITVDEVA